MAGGSSRIVKIRELLQAEFDNKSLCHHIHPDEAVAYGAAVQAALLTCDNIATFDLACDRLPHTIGQGIWDGTVVPVLPKNTPLPNPRERDCKVSALPPFTEHHMIALSQRVVAKKTFYPLTNDQKSMTIAIFEGDTGRQEGCKLLGTFKLENLAPSTFFSQTRIKTTYEVDHNGILQVSAEEVSSKGRNKQSVKINKCRLSKDEINEAIRDNAHYRREQEKRRLRNQVSNPLYYSK